MVPFVPICLDKQLYIPKQEDVTHPNLAVCCLFTEREKIVAELKEQNIVPAVIGNLYSHGRGFDPMVRNLLANPQIRKLLCMGEDRGGTITAYLEFWDATRRLAFGDVVSFERFGLGVDIELRYLRDLADRLGLYTITLFSDEDGAVKPDWDAVHTWADRSEILDDYEKILLPMQEPTMSETVPTVPFGGVIYGKTVEETYLKMLRYIRINGHTTDTHYQQAQQEVWNLTCVITDEVPAALQTCIDSNGVPERAGSLLSLVDGETGHGISMFPDSVREDLARQYPDWLPMDGLKKYAEDLWEGKPPQGTKYTYGSLMRGCPTTRVVDEIVGIDDHGVDRVYSVEVVDGVEAAIEKLIQDPDQRSAGVGLFSGEHARTKSGTPCLVFVIFRAIAGRFHATFVIRSNDMAYGWPMNAAGFRNFQWRVLDRIKRLTRATENEQFWSKVRPGYTITHSISAHIYSDCWEWADELIEKHYDQVAGYSANPTDPFGNWLIRVGTECESRTGLEAVLVDGLTGRPSKKFAAKTARELCELIAPYVHDTSHAMYLGRELYRAEQCYHSTTGNYIQE